MKMNLTEKQIKVLNDNGFLSPWELYVYREYDSNRLGCSLENRFYILEEEGDYVGLEYELIDMLMAAAYGEDGMNWRLMQQSLIQGEEPSREGATMCPFYADELTVLTPEGSEESYFFDVTSYMLSINDFSPGKDNK